MKHLPSLCRPPFPSAPIFTFDLDAAVANVCWAPYSSTVLAAVTTDRMVSAPLLPLSFLFGTNQMPDY